MKTFTFLRMKMRFLSIFLLGMFFLLHCLQGSHRPQHTGNNNWKAADDEISYLQTLSKDTWRYLDSYLSPISGFPYDTPTKRDVTNTTNIGLYLASLCVAHHAGYIDTKSALKRATKILDTLDKTENWNRLYENWLSADAPAKTRSGVLSYISDYNKLPVGIIMLRQEFPSLAQRCTEFLKEINWGLFYNSFDNSTNAQFDVASKSIKTPVRISRGEDSLMMIFLGVGAGDVDPRVFDGMQNNYEVRADVQYFKPGWQAGGIFMQFLCGIFIDNEATPLGYSAANFAFAQIQHARNIGSPAWGWSAAEGPDGNYYGWGKITDRLVTPHASVLAIELFPREVLANLHTLESIGVREPLVRGDKTYAYGFRDSVDLKTLAVSNSYLCLDQAMLFLSLENYLKKGIVRKIFAKDPWVSHAYNIIGEYKVSTKDREKYHEYLRDLQSRLASTIKTSK